MRPKIAADKKEIIKIILLINMAKFRNLLVHLYWKIDDEKINEILQKELTDFDEFIRQIAKRYL
jgi:uncharacterized protein YutE (UPF0331/DUF86 family)